MSPDKNHYKGTFYTGRVRSLRKLDRSCHSSSQCDAHRYGHECTELAHTSLWLPRQSLSCFPPGSMPRSLRIGSSLAINALSASCTSRLSVASCMGVSIAEECQRACFREICTADQVPNDVGGEKPSFWIIRGARIRRCASPSHLASTA